MFDKDTKVTVIKRDGYKKILRVGEEAGAVPLKRPAELATNETTGDDLAGWQADSVPQAEIIIQVVPTSPFITGSVITIAAKNILLRKVDSVVGVRNERLFIWKYEFGPAYYEDSRIPNSQDLSPTTYETTGLYAVRRCYAAQRRRRMNSDATRSYPLSLSRIEAIDINTEEDFQFAKIVWKGLQC